MQWAVNHVLILIVQIVHLIIWGAIFVITIMAYLYNQTEVNVSLVNLDVIHVKDMVVKYVPNAQMDIIEKII